MPNLDGVVSPDVFYGLAALVCPLGMGAMMWFMTRGSQERQRLGAPMPPGPPAATVRGHDPELSRMRTEIDQLRAAVAERERDVSARDRS